MITFPMTRRHAGAASGRAHRHEIHPAHRVAQGACGDWLVRAHAPDWFNLAGLSARYMFSSNWGITGRVAYGRLVGDAAKSSIVKSEGSENQFSGGLAVLDRF